MSIWQHNINHGSLCGHFIDSPAAPIECPAGHDCTNPFKGFDFVGWHPELGNFWKCKQCDFVVNSTIIPSSCPNDSSEDCGNPGPTQPQLPDLTRII